MNDGYSAIPTSGAEHHEHPPHLAHHFDTPRQQYESGKLGMWAFLATEILMFGGLFCAYSVYRSNHPDVFIYAHQFLDKILGGINTCVLICSSLTMAWAVRTIQLNKPKATAVLLSLTILGGCGFMSIKYAEYKHKWESGLLWGAKYNPTIHEGEHGDVTHDASAAAGSVAAGEQHDQPAETADATKAAADDPPAAEAKNESTATGENRAVAGSGVAEGGHQPPPVPAETSTIKPAAIGPPGLADFVLRGEQRADDQHHMPEPKKVSLFFSIYFLMTGLHGLHVLVGMGLLSWILIRTLKGQFNSEYFMPVDLVGLYWHLVDLIWIFLFPLLYLIH